MMKRKGLCWLMLICLAVSFCAMAQGMELAEPMEGTLAYPQGVDEGQATYLLRYQYPQFVEKTASDKAINEYYQAACENLRNFAIPQSIEEIVALKEEGSPAYYTDIQCQLTANTDEYISVTLTSKQFLGNGESESLIGNVFARDGVYAGQLVTLSQVMGLEQEDVESGETESFASRLVYKLVWQIIVKQQAGLQKDYFDQLTEKDLETAFVPETDFYIDMDGNLVFYIQPGMIAGEVEGILTYPFSIGELLTAIEE